MLRTLWNIVRAPICAESLRAGLLCAFVVLRTLWNIVRAPICAESLRAGLLCAFVVLLNVAAGMAMLKIWYNFWLNVFVFALTPTWLMCCGLLFATRWRWRELALGVFTALFVLTWLYMRSGNDPLFQNLTAILAAGFGVALMTIGYTTTCLGRSLAHDVKAGQPLQMLRRMLRASMVIWRLIQIKTTGLRPAHTKRDRVP